MSHPKINFTPGPSQLYFTVEDHVRTAFREGIPSLSHRSRKFEAIYRETSEGLRELLSVPADFHVLFTASATEIWERIIQNLVVSKSLHLVNGSFSRKFNEVALQLGRQATTVERPAGHGFTGSVDVPADVELVALTHNETSTGVSMPLSVIGDIRNGNKEVIIAVDAVSSLPYPDFDYHAIDTVFFSVQKGFGLPAGLGVWLVNERCAAKANAMLSRVSIGSYHSLPSLLQHESKFQTPETPNVLGIYLLGKVIGDMLRTGIQRIRKETEYKAAILYQELNRHEVLKPLVADAQCQSKTVIVANTGASTKLLTETLLSRGMQAGAGYGDGKATQLRFANFPTHAREHFEQLCDIIKEFEG